jgi:Glycosyl hydrolases family 2, TIM barrel domain/Glycosyl hydrolases family 2, sugar binding domain/Glycosyl hydrolases family 2
MYFVGHRDRLIMNPFRNTYRIALTLSLIFLSFRPSPAGDWTMAPSPIVTPWAKDVSPTNALAEYPRPQLVRTNWVNLNGLWDYAIADAHSAKPTDWQGSILVPFAIESALSGVGKAILPQQSLWYHTSFKKPAVTDSGRVLLHFGAVDWLAKVWVNDQLLGEHRGGFDGFSFDITEAIARRDNNSLVVQVWDPSDEGSQPRGKQVRNPEGIFYTSVTGIWQTVWLETVPSQYIRSVRITPDVDHSRFTVTADVSATSDLTIQIFDGEKQVAMANGSSDKPIALTVEQPKLWSPDSPHLYDFVIRSDGDEVRSYSGLRKISIGPDGESKMRMLLNNQPLFQMGPLDQGWWPDGLYTAPTDEALKFDVEMTRKMGFNMARKHVKVEPDRWYYWADRLGLLVWQDMPSLMASGHTHQVLGGQLDDIRLTAQESLQYQSELRAMMTNLYNHPSIVVWVPFNEGWGQHNTNTMLQWAKSLDPTRLIDGPSGWEDRSWGDLKDMHNYPGPGMFPVLPDRVSVLGEFGGLGLPVEDHLWQKDRNWGYQSFKAKDALSRRYEELINNLHRLVGRGLSAAVYTQTTDVEGEVNGLMTYDRQVIKIAPEKLAEWHARLHEPPPIEITVLPTAPQFAMEQQPASQWAFTTDKPAGNWQSVAFDDQSWKRGPGGFGEKSTPGSTVNTDWKTNDIWLRTSFAIKNVEDADYWLSIYHDEDAEIYINGVEAAKLSGFSGSYIQVRLSDAAKKSLKTGNNTIAIHCHQTFGGQYIDAGIMIVKPAKTAAK